MAIKTKQILAVDFSKTDSILNAKGKTALNFVGVEGYTGISGESDGKKILLKKDGVLIATISNITGLKYTEVNGDAHFTTDIIESAIRYTGSYNIKKGVVTGSNYVDILDYHDYHPTDPVTLVNNKGLTIKAGGGFDDITGTSHNDTIIGGSGTNFLHISITEDFGDDTVVLTKDEKLQLILDKDDNYTFNDETGNYDEKYTETKIIGNDLKIIVYSEGGYNESNAHNGAIRGTITVKGYAKKDLTGENGYISVVSGLEEYSIDEYLFKKTDLTASKYKGSWLNDYVNAENYIAKDKKGREITTNTDKVKGVNIDLGEAYYYNEAIGSKYADTIKGGKYSNIIRGGKGNDVITGGNADNSVYHTKGDGHDIINLSKGERISIRMEGFDNFIDDLKFRYVNKNRDLQIYYLNDEGQIEGSVTIKNFAKKDATNNATKNNSDTGLVYLEVYSTGGACLHPYNLKNSTQWSDVASDWVHVDLFKVETDKNLTGSRLDDYIDASEAKLTKTIGKGKKKQTVDKVEADKGLTLKGAGGDDTVYGSKYSDKLYGGSGNDAIFGGKGNDTISGDVGNDYLYGEEGNDIIKGGAGNDTIDGGKGNDKLYGEKGNNEFVFHAADGVDTIYNGKGVDSIRFADLTDQALLNFEQVKNSKGKMTNDLRIYYDIDRTSYVTVKDYFKKVKGKYITSIKNIYIGNSTSAIDITSAMIANNYEGVLIDASKGGSGNITIDDTNKDTIKYIITGSGDDIIDADAAAGAVQINAGEGNNQVSALNNKANRIITGSGDDTITTSSANGVIIEAGDGANAITVGGGQVNITVGNSTITNPEDENFNKGSEISIYGLSQNSVINGGTGNDTYNLVNNENGKPSQITINDKGGDNKINFMKDFDDYSFGTQSTIITGSGDDTLNMGKISMNDIDLGDGHNIINLKGRDNIITTGSGTDEMYFTGNVAESNVINAGDGENIITSERATGYNITTGKDKDIITLGTTSGGGLNNIVNAGDGDNEISFLNTAGGTIITGSGKDTINVEATTTINSAAGDDEITIASGSYIHYITAGSGDDTITFEEGAGGTQYFYFNKGDGSDTIKGLTNSGSYYINLSKELSYITRKNSESPRNLEIVMYDEKGNPTGDMITIENYYQENGITPVNSSISVNNYNISQLENPTTVIKDTSTTIQGTNNSDVIFGTSGNDTIMAGSGYDFVRPLKGNDTVDFSSSNNNVIYFLKDEGNLTIKNIGSSLIVYTDFEEDTLNFSKFEIKGKDAVLTKANGQVLTLENVMGTSGFTAKNIYFKNYETPWENSSILLETLLNGKDIDIYPDSTGKVYPKASANCTIMTDDKENSIYIPNAKGTYTIIGGDAAVQGANVDTIDLLNWGDSMLGAISNEFVGDDLIFSRTISENEIVTIVIKDYLKNPNTVNKLNIKDGVILRNITISEHFQHVMQYNSGNTPSTITGTWARDQIQQYGNVGDIIVNAGAGDDKIIVGTTSATINGEDGNDIIDVNSMTGGAIIRGGKGNDTISATNGYYNSFYFKKGDGNDIIRATADIEKEGANGGDYIEIGGYNTLTNEDFDFEISGRDLIIKYNHVNSVSQDSITIENYINEAGEIDSSVKFLAPDANGESFGLQEITELYKEKYGNITINSGSDDTINGGVFDEIFTIEQSTTGKTVNGGSGDDEFKIYSSGNTLNGQKGNDKYNLEGSNTATFVFSDNGGHDVIEGYGYPGQEQSIVKFENLTTEKLTSPYIKFDDSDGSNLYIYYANSTDTLDDINDENYIYPNSIKIGSFVNMYPYNVENDGVLWFNQLVGSEGTIDPSKTIFNLYNPVINNTNGHLGQVVRGTIFDDTITARQDDMVYANYGNDTISAVGGSSVVVEGGAGEDTITITGNVNGTTVYGDTEGWRSNNKGSNDIINGGSGNDKIYGCGGNDTITGGSGSDQLTGGYGADEYHFAKGDGVDSVIGNYEGNDTLVFDDVDFSGLDIHRASNIYDLEIGYGNSGDKITVSGDTSIKIKDQNDDIKNVMFNFDENGPVSFEGTDGDDIILMPNWYGYQYARGGARDDVIYFNGNFADYRFSVGDGNDTIYDTGTSGSKISFMDSGMSLEDTNFAKAGNDLVIYYGVNDSITVKNYFNNNGTFSGNNVTTLKFADDSTYYTINSQEGNISRIPVIGNATHTGNDLNEIISLNPNCNGAAVSGGGGYNTFKVKVTANSYTNTIITTSNNDTLLIDNSTTGVTADTNGTTGLKATVSGDNVIISPKNVAYGRSAYVIKDALKSEIALTISDGTNTTTLNDIMEASNIQVKNGNIHNTIYGTDNNDCLVALGGNHIEGRKGSDTMISYKTGWVYTNGFDDEKDTSEGTVDTVELYGISRVYAQSETNIINAHANNDLNCNNSYYVYLDQTTIITDEKGNDDYFKLVDTPGTVGISAYPGDEQKGDGAYTLGGLQNTYIMCDVAADYENGDDFDVYIFGSHDKVGWLKGNDAPNSRYITIKDNAIEQIYTSDGYKITSEQLNTLAQQTASWLNTYNSAHSTSYGSIGAIRKESTYSILETCVDAMQNNNHAGALWTK